MPEFTFHVTGPDLASALRTLDRAGIKAYGPATTARGGGERTERTPLVAHLAAADATTARARIQDLLGLGYQVKIAPRDL